MGASQAETKYRWMYNGRTDIQTSNESKRVSYKFVFEKKQNKTDASLTGNIKREESNRSIKRM